MNKVKIFSQEKIFDKEHTAQYLQSEINKFAEKHKIINVSISSTVNC